MNIAGISLMREEDLEVIHEIEERAFPQPWTVNMFRGELLNPEKRIYLTARIEDRIVGYGGLMLVDGEAHVTTLAVDTTYRKRGIGSLLALRIIEFAMLKRVHWLSLEVRESNEAAKRMYGKFGFRQIGLRKKYYADGENAVIMWTNDIQSDDYRNMLVDLKENLLK
jgi:ribosomal-protein-alanine N-acetyltransferase